MEDTYTNGVHPAFTNKSAANARVRSTRCVDFKNGPILPGNTKVHRRTDLNLEVNAHQCALKRNKTKYVSPNIHDKSESPLDLTSSKNGSSKECKLKRASLIKSFYPNNL